VTVQTCHAAQAEHSVGGSTCITDKRECRLSARATGIGARDGHRISGAAHASAMAMWVAMWVAVFTGCLPCSSRRIRSKLVDILPKHSRPLATSRGANLVPYWPRQER
jgi:hypothetical protein